MEVPIGDNQKSLRIIKLRVDDTWWDATEPAVPTDHSRLLSTYMRTKLSNSRISILSEKRWKRNCRLSFRLSSQRHKVQAAVLQVQAVKLQASCSVHQAPAKMLMSFQRLDSSPSPFHLTGPTPVDISSVSEGWAARMSRREVETNVNTE
jgi:hypothetical protein